MAVGVALARVAARVVAEEALAGSASVVVALVQVVQAVVQALVVGEAKEVASVAEEDEAAALLELETATVVEETDAAVEGPAVAKGSEAKCPHQLGRRSSAERCVLEVWRRQLDLHQ